MKHILNIFLLLFSFSGISQIFSEEQQYQIDSLNSVISNPRIHNTIIVMTYLEIANYYYLQVPDTAIVICEKAKGISEKFGFKRGKA